ncbi:MAG: small multi-drug export protein [Methanobacteriota archaeon]
MNKPMSYPEKPAPQIIFLIIPFFVLFCHLGIMVFTLPYSLFLVMLGLMLGYILPPAGKETIIPLGIALGIPWWYIALSITLVDIETGLFMTLNFDYVHRIPVVGPMIRDLTVQTSEMIARHPWVSGLYVFAIILMVMVPVLGSGGVRGSIAGRILGLTPDQILFGISVGAIIGCFAIALGSDQLFTYICGNGFLPEGIPIVICPK